MSSNRMCVRPFSLPRQARMRNRADFFACYEQGLRRHTKHFLVFLHTTRHACARLGVAVSRKVGNAVVRNRIKRLLREYFRLHKDCIPHTTDMAVVAKKHAGNARLTLACVCAELTPLLQNIKQQNAMPQQS